MKLLLCAGAALAALAVAGCGSTTVIKTVTESSATRTSPSTASATASARTSRPDILRVGDPVTVRTSETTLQLKVTQVLDPLPVGEYDEPDSGSRFVGVGLSVRNIGSTPYSDALANGSTLILAGATQATTTTVSGGPCGNGFDSDVKIAPGDVRKGCIAFEVPANKRLRSFQFTGDSGFADQTAQWELPSQATAQASPAAAASSAGGTAWHACDANIAVGPNTTCPFAENVFYEYYEGGQPSSVTAYSRALGVSLMATCSSGDPIVCSTRDGGTVRFSQAAIDAYSPAQADRYAATHDTGH